MSEHIYKQVELTGSSRTGTDEAIQNAIARASQTIERMDWFQVMDTRGAIKEGKIEFWQVTIKVGFRLND